MALVYYTIVLRLARTQFGKLQSHSLPILYYVEWYDASHLKISAS